MSVIKMTGWETRTPKHKLAKVQTFKGEKIIHVEKIVLFNGKPDSVSGDGFKFKFDEEPFEIMDDNPDMTPDVIAAMLRVAFKEGIQIGFDWPKLAIAEVHKQQLYEAWAAGKADDGEKEAVVEILKKAEIEEGFECGCPEGAEDKCVSVTCPRK